MAAKEGKENGMKKEFSVMLRWVVLATAALGFVAGLKLGEVAIELGFVCAVGVAAGFFGVIAGIFMSLGTLCGWKRHLAMLWNGIQEALIGCVSLWIGIAAGVAVCGVSVIDAIRLGHITATVCAACVLSLAAMIRVSMRRYYADPTTFPS